MSQNIVIPNKDNKVVFVFSGVDLTLATDIVVTFGAETYSVLLEPNLVVVVDAVTLSIDLKSTSEVGEIFPVVTYFDDNSINGTEITSQILGGGKIVVAVGSQLIIEDGSQVADANSFVTDAEYQAYALLRGLTVSVTQPQREADLLAAVDYLQGNEGSMKGTRTSSTQSLMYPRYNVDLYGYLLASDKIPKELKEAQFEAAAYSTSASILVNSNNTNIKREQLGDMSAEYFSGGNMNRVNLQRVNSKLGPLLKSVDRVVRT